MFRVHAEPVSLVNIHKHYYTNDKTAICSIRADLFALGLLNGGPFKKCLVGEQGKGLLVGAVMLRGGLVSVLGSAKKPKDLKIPEQLNIPREDR